MHQTHLAACSWLQQSLTGEHESEIHRLFLETFQRQLAVRAVMNSPASRCCRLSPQVHTVNPNGMLLRVTGHTLKIAYFLNL